MVQLVLFGPQPSWRHKPRKGLLVRSRLLYWSMSKTGKIVVQGARSVGHSCEGVTVAGEIRSCANRILCLL